MTIVVRLHYSDFRPCPFVFTRSQLPDHVQRYACTVTFDLDPLEVLKTFDAHQQFSMGLPYIDRCTVTCSQFH